MRNDYSSNYLAHHGILGMKWGIRRYQNPDGTLTAAGRERYALRTGQIANLKERSNNAKIASAKAQNKLKKMHLNVLKEEETYDAKKATKLRDTDLKNQAKAQKLDAQAEKIIAKALKELGHISEDDFDAKVHAGEAKLQKILAKNTELDRKYEKERNKQANEMQKELGDDETPIKYSNKEVDARMAKSLNDGFGKYKVDKQYAHLYDAIELKNKSETQQKLGNDKVNFVINNFNYNRETRSYEQAEPQEKAIERAQNFLKNFNVNEAKEEIAKQYYDSWKEEYKDQGVSRSEFKAAIKPYHVDIDNHEAYVSFDDGGLVGYHSLDIGVDPETMKIKYHSMNG